MMSSIAGERVENVIKRALYRDNLVNIVATKRKSGIVPYLELAFLGQFQVTLNGQLVTAFETNKVRALLVYLAVEADRAHSRSALAALLWPDYSEQSGRTNLRHVLYALRQTIQDTKASPPLLRVTRQKLQFNAAADYKLDIADFTSALANCASHAHAQLEQCRPCRQRLRQAAELYRGDFLAGFTIQDCVPFEEWRRVRQEQLHLQALETLGHLANTFEASGDDEQARFYAERQIALEPWRESAHRQIMRLLAGSGQRSAAVDQYHACRLALGVELGVEPDVATTALYEQIKAGVHESFGAKRQVVEPEPQAVSPIHDWGEMPDAGDFYGRQAELTQLHQWLVAEPCRLVAILGMGGVGKTTLAAKAVSWVADQFPFVIWRSLLNAPPLDEILRSWLQLLSHQTLVELPESLDEQLRLLLDYLRQQRVLLVLDNLESILATGDRAGELRPGYEAYRQLLQHLGASDHASCLLLTSREQPRIIAQLQRSTTLVQVLHLAGIDQVAGSDMLQNRGLAASAEQGAELIAHYSGNPLALILVAETIQGFFAGNVTDFLSQSALVFDHIRDVLDEQCARLSDMERAILFWLAIEREAVSAATLSENLVAGISQRDLLEALRSLQRRCLLEVRGDTFTMQNVVIEYVTDYLIELIYQEIRQGHCELLNSHALLKAQAREYVRQSQVRLLLQPLAERLLAQLGQEELEARLKALLDHLRAVPSSNTGYAGGNILNLLLQLEIHPRGYDFSHLPVRQAYLRGREVTEINFAHANLAQSVFTDTFGYIYAVAFSPDGQLIAAGTGDGEIRLWRADDGQPVGLLTGHMDSVTTLDFHPEGAILVSGSHDQTIRIWNLQTKELVHQMIGHGKGGVKSVSFSSDGSLLASGGRDHLVRVWDTASGELKHTLRGHADWVRSVSFSPQPDKDRLLLASGADDSMIIIWNAATGERLHAFQGDADRVNSVAFSPDGSLLASGGHDKIVRLWDVQKRNLHHTLEGHNGWLWNVAFSPDGNFLASASTDETVQLWNLHTNQIYQLLRYKGGMNTIAFNSDGRLLLAGGPQAVHLWNMHTGQRHYSLEGYNDWVRSIASSPDGRTLAVGSSEQMIRLWNLQSPVMDSQVHHILRGHTKWINSVSFSPDGKTVASSSADNTIRLWDAQSGETRQILHGHKLWVWSISFHPNGNALASGGSDCTVRLWNIQNADSLILHEHTRRILAVAFSPDGKLLASGGDDQVVYVWDMQQGQVVYSLQEHNDTIWSIAFSPDGQYLAGAGTDRIICLWDVKTGHLRHRLQVAIGGVRTIAFAPYPTHTQEESELLGRTLLASGGEDSIVRLWDVETGELYREFEGHTQVVRTLTFIFWESDNQLYLASGGADKTIRLWDINTGEAVAVLRAPGPYAGMNITSATGITEVQKTALLSLGAVEIGEVQSSG